MRKPVKARSTRFVKIQMSTRATRGANPASSASRHPICGSFPLPRCEPGLTSLLTRPDAETSPAEGEPQRPSDSHDRCDPGAHASRLDGDLERGGRCVHTRRIEAD